MTNSTQSERVQMVTSLSIAIQDRWKEAQLEPCPNDIVRAGLAAIEFLEAALDEQSPWDARNILDGAEPLV